MSYLSDLKHGRLTVSQFLKKSVGWLAEQAHFTDSDVDDLVREGTKKIDDCEDEATALFSAAIATAFPAVPAALRDVLATRAVHAGFALIDAGLSGLGEELKKITPDDQPQAA